ncbi:MAG TPA: glycosyltransferase family 2 protein, partial [Methylococcales bacterium]
MNRDDSHCQPKQLSVVPLVVAVVVNWNGERDTIECLEALLASEYQNLSVIVVDNGSAANSLNAIKDWAQTQLLLNPQRAWSAATRFQVIFPPTNGEWNKRSWEERALLMLVPMQHNLGFGAGNNVGIKLALSNTSTEFVWLLNNDAVPTARCLDQMVSRIQRDPDVGMCGCRLLFYREPELVQALGGARFYPWIAESRDIGYLSRADRKVDSSKIEAKLDHLSGASMLVRRSFIEDVGLLDEGYFLYYEEMDWIIRSAARYKLAYADDAVVHHKLGASTCGSDFDRKLHRSSLSAFFMTKSRLRFTRKFYPWALPTVVGYCILWALWTYARGRRPQA